VKEDKLKLVDTGKSKVVSFRVGENVYQELEKIAELQGGTISASARSLLLSSLDTENMVLEPGNVVSLPTTDFVVMLVDSSTTGAAIKARIMDMSGKKEKKKEE